MKAKYIIEAIEQLHAAEAEVLNPTLTPYERGVLSAKLWTAAHDLKYQSGLMNIDIPVEKEAA